MTRTVAAGVLSSQLWEGLRSDPRALSWVALLQVVFILAAWLLVRVLVPRREMNNFGQYERREGAGLGKAILFYLGYLVLTVLVIIGLRWTSTSFKLALLGLFTHPFDLGDTWIAVFALLAPIVLAVALGWPMALFRIRLMKAFILLALILAVLAGAGWALDTVLGKPVAKSAQVVHEWAARRRQDGGIIKSLAAQAEEDVRFVAAERIAADPTKTLAERKDAVRSLYAQLGEIRAALPEGDTSALAQYDKKMARYVELLKQLRNEIGRKPAAAE